jgi:hypothetical protein
MAIQQFGESLLEDIRKRKERQERELRKQEERAALLGLGVNLATKIGNERLANKMSEFLKQAPIYNQTLIQKSANRAQTVQSGIQQQLDSQGVDIETWAYNQAKPIVEAGIKAELQDPSLTTEFTDYASIVDKRTKAVAQKYAESYRELTRLSDNVLSKEDFDAQVALHANKGLSQDVGQYALRELSELFGGKSREDMELEALTAITEGPMAQNAQALDTFMKAYRSVGSLARAQDFTDVVVGKIRDDKLITVEEDETITSGGGVQSITRVKTYDPSRNNALVSSKLKTDSQGDVAVSTLFEDPDKAGDDFHKLIGVLNPFKEARFTLNERGQALFNNRLNAMLVDPNPTKRLDPKKLTPETYEAVFKEYLSIASDSDYQENSLRAQLITEVGSAMLRDDLPFMSDAFRNFQTDPSEANRQALISRTYDFVNALTGRLAEASDVEDFSVLSSGSGSPITVPSSVIDFLLQGNNQR